MAGEEPNGLVRFGFQLSGDMEMIGYYVAYRFPGDDQDTYFRSKNPRVIDAFLRGIWEGYRLDKLKATNK